VLIDGEDITFGPGDMALLGISRDAHEIQKYLLVGQRLATA
jgi:hypothetical protein